MWGGSGCGSPAPRLLPWRRGGPSTPLGPGDRSGVCPSPVPAAGSGAVSREAAAPAVRARFGASLGWFASAQRSSEPSFEMPARQLSQGNPLIWVGERPGRCPLPLVLALKLAAPQVKKDPPVSLYLVRKRCHTNRPAVIVSGFEN